MPLSSAFWDRIKGSVPYESYVADVSCCVQAMLTVPSSRSCGSRETVVWLTLFARSVLLTASCAEEDSSSLPVQLIELNPFDAATDGALYSWALHLYTMLPYAARALIVFRRSIEVGPPSFRFVQEEEIIRYFL
jgi:hypothetical protein